MHDAMQITVGILFLILVFILTRYGITWRIKRAGRRIINDLETPGSSKALIPLWSFPT